MILPPNTRRHVISALSLNPWILRRLVETTRPEDPRWSRAEQDRFTCAMVVAHLEDWELVFMERLRRTLAEDAAEVEDADADDRARAMGYETADPTAAASGYAERRRSLIALLEGLDERSWGRQARHPRHGLVTVEAQAVHVLGHDGHHLGYLARLLSEG